jgi:hypothetical protein
MGKLKGNKIIEIIKIQLNEVLLELRFKVQNDESYNFSCGINSDGESIFYRESQNVNEQSYADSIYTHTVINYNSKDSLSNILNKEINSIKFGVGYSLISQVETLYYLKISTGDNEFLFFNNGDNGYYSLDNNIEKILENDIYEYEWRDSWKF